MEEIHKKIEDYVKNVEGPFFCIMGGEGDRIEVCKDITLKAADFSLNSLKTPKIDKSDRDDDPNSLFLEKVFLIETAVTLLDCLYRQFLGLRLDEGKWKKTTDKMMQWMKEAF